MLASIQVLESVKVLVARLRPTLCDLMDCSLPESSVHGILQARILQPFPSPGDLPGLGIEPWSPALEADSLWSELPGKPSIPQRRGLGRKQHLKRIVLEYNSFKEGGYSKTNTLPQVTSLFPGVIIKSQRARLFSPSLSLSISPSLLISFLPSLNFNHRQDFPLTPKPHSLQVESAHQVNVIPAEAKKLTIFINMCKYALTQVSAPSLLDILQSRQ